MIATDKGFIYKSIEFYLFAFIIIKVIFNNGNLAYNVKIM